MVSGTPTYVDRAVSAPTDFGKYVIAKTSGFIRRSVRTSIGSIPISLQSRHGSRTDRVFAASDEQAHRVGSEAQATDSKHDVSGHP